MRKKKASRMVCIRCEGDSFAYLAELDQCGCAFIRVIMPATRRLSLVQSALTRMQGTEHSMPGQGELAFLLLL